MRTILLSIKPKYSKLIFDGSKKFEFRKIIAKKAVDKIIVYSSSPDKVIIGEVYVTGIVSMKDTFNKLGYKAKINTHTTSYIN